MDRFSLACCTIAVTAGVLAAVPAPAGAQTNSWINSGVQFDFPPPGARSLALGGAFVSVADDATAAVANPAGLTLLVKPEVSIEARYWNFSTVSPLRGRYLGAPTNVGFDNIAEFIKEPIGDSLSGISFLSAVFPKNRFAFAFYRQEQSRYRSSMLSDGIFMHDELANTDEDRLDPFKAQLALDVVNYGFSAGYRFANGLALGGGLAISDFSIDSQTDIYYIGLGPNLIPPANRDQHTAPGQGFGPPDFSDLNFQGGVIETGDDTGVALNFGALYRPSGSKWSVGGAVRLGPEFEYDAEARWGPVQDRFPGPPDNGDLIDSDHVAFKIPDTYSVGLSYRPSDRLLFVGQYDFVQFSQLSSDVQEVFGIAEPVHTEYTEGLSFPDSNQIRFGTEYAVAISPHVVSLRLGGAFVSDHQMQYQQVGAFRFPRIEVIFQGGENQWHVTPGVGIAFTQFQIDGAFDISERTKTLSVSAVYRF